MSKSSNPSLVLPFRVVVVVVVVAKEDASMELNLTHPLNTLHEIEMRFSGKCTEVKEEHP